MSVLSKFKGYLKGNTKKDRELFSGKPDTVHSALLSPSFVHTSPFPYFVKDGFVPPETYAELLQHWPSESLFYEDRTDGCRLIDICREEKFSLFSSEQQKFWRSFTRGHIVDMVRESMFAFGEKAVHKYKDELDEIFIYAINLTQAFKPLQYLNIHTHHGNSPNFIGTSIYYVDDDGYAERGTSIYGLKEDAALTLDEYVDLCGEVEYEHRSEIELKRVIDFAPNRLLSIIDSPLSFHAVDNRKYESMRGPRKMITTQWGVRGDWYEKIYGMDLETHWRLRRERPLCEEIKNVLKGDLVNFYEEKAYTQEEFLKAYSKVSITGAGFASTFREPLMVSEQQQSYTYANGENLCLVS